MAVRYTRAERLAQIQDGIDRGLTHREIAAGLSMSRSGVRSILNDPDGAKQKERRKRYQGQCETCGAATDGSGGLAKAPRHCCHCAPGTPEYRAKVTKWTPERCIGAMLWWNHTYGSPPAAPDWNPLQCEGFGDAERAERGRALIASGTVPWFTLVVNRFGSWNAGLQAAGFDARPAHGGGGNETRRRTRPMAAHRFGQLQLAALEVLLSASGATTPTELGRRAGMSRRQAWTVLRSLKTRGLVEQPREGFYRAVRQDVAA